MSAEARAESFRRVDATHRGTFDAIDVVNHGVRLAEWQAARDAVRIAELEGEVERLRHAPAGDRADRVMAAQAGLIERLHAEIAAVRTHERQASKDVGIALLDSEERLDLAEAKLAGIRNLVSLVLPDDEKVTHVNAAKIRAILDGAV